MVTVVVTVVMKDSSSCCMSVSCCTMAVWSTPEAAAAGLAVVLPVAVVLFIVAGLATEREPVGGLVLLRVAVMAVSLVA